MNHTPFRRHDRATRPLPQGDPNTTGDDNLEAIRDVARDLLAAGDRAIEHALSGNSERFLRANRQSGGE